MKNSNDTGTPIKILLANVIVFSKSLCSIKEKAKTMMLTSGSEIINPAKLGFLNESQLVNEINKLEIKTLKIKGIIT